MMPLWRRLCAGLVEMVYPRTCAGCGMRGTWLCDLCLTSVPRLDSGICFRCGAPVQQACRSCAQMDRSIQIARAAYPYMGWVSSAIRSFKYGEEWSRAPHLARCMAPLIDAFGDVDAIVPVPLHPGKLRLRGFNQSELLARSLGELAGIPMMPMLSRNRETRSQVDLSGENRRSNVDGAFGLDPRWAPNAGRSFLLVDDVRTTSSTLNACARELQRTGPSRIAAVTLAYDMPQRELRAWLDEHGRRVIT